MLTGGIWHKALPTAKSDTDVMVTGTTDAVTDIDTGQALVNSEEETASIPAHSESQYIDRVVMEILETERTYVKDLKDIIDVSSLSTVDKVLLIIRLCFFSKAEARSGHSVIHGQEM